MPVQVVVVVDFPSKSSVRVFRTLENGRHFVTWQQRSVTSCAGSADFKRAANGSNR
jgi:hypothetical protein